MKTVKVDEVIRETAKICRSFHAKEVILYGSRAKGTARERSDIDIAVSGVENFDLLAEKDRGIANPLQCGPSEYGHMQESTVIGGYQGIWEKNLKDGLCRSAIHWTHWRRQEKETFPILLF